MEKKPARATWTVRDFSQSVKNLIVGLAKVEQLTVSDYLESLVYEVIGTPEKREIFQAKIRSTKGTPVW